MSQSSSRLSAMFSLTGQTALVTGGTRGIGASMAITLAEAGADILLVQRDGSNDATKKHIESIGRKATILIADLAKPDAAAALAKAVLETSTRIHILVNCAGIQRRHAAENFPTRDWDDVLQVNLSSVFELCREIGAHMLKQDPDSSGGRGVIVNVASLLSFQGGITVPAYAASKGGVAQLTKALSNEWAGKGVRVNAIAPGKINKTRFSSTCVYPALFRLIVVRCLGYVATEMNAALIGDKDRASSILSRIPAGRWGEPDDFKGVVVFLASRASAYVSGEILTIDGGWMGR